MDFDLKGELIYLSSPYTHEDPFVREVRFLEACKATSWVIDKLRLNAIGAMVHSHPLVTRYNMPVEWEFWANYDTAIIKAAREVWVLCIPGWTNSMGVTTECGLAREMGKRIRYLVPSSSDGVNHYVAASVSDRVNHYMILDDEPDENKLYGRIEPGRLGHPPFKAE